MEYEVVELQEKQVAGLVVRTNNQSPDLGQKIGSLWQRFYEGGVYRSIPGKINEKSIGLYTNYETDETGNYDFFACCEVEGSEVPLPAGLSSVTIPTGQYAKFIVRGDMVTAVAEFWQRLWGMKLSRKFGCDFEEYQPCCREDTGNCEIHIYISLEAENSPA